MIAIIFLDSTYLFIATSILANEGNYIGASVV